MAVPGEEQEVFAVVAAKTCKHLDALPAVEKREVDCKAKCATCDNQGENWLCLHCGNVGCGRYVKQHGVEHNTANAEHTLVLSFADLSVWCYACEVYLDNEKLQAVKVAAYKSKFGQDPPAGF